MPLKQASGRSPSTRHMSVVVTSDLTKKKPEKSLTRGKKSTGGRNHVGHMTSRFRGGGHKRSYRLIDFKRNKLDMAATVTAIEYDPNRSARIALLQYTDGEKRYILCPIGLNVGDTVTAGPTAPLKPGNALPLGNIPPGISIHNIEMVPGHGGAVARSAGQLATLRAVEGKYAQVKMPSGEIRLLHVTCMATIGQVGNLDHMNQELGKAGASRFRGRRPHVRGTVMNPIDHPMGGGEGRTSGGGHPCSPWGQLAKGFKTRKKSRNSSKFIVERRKK